MLLGRSIHSLVVMKNCEQVFCSSQDIVRIMVTNGDFDFILNIDIKIVRLVKLLTLYFLVHFQDGTCL